MSRTGPAWPRRSTSTTARSPSTEAPTRCSAPSSPARSWGSEANVDFTFDSEQHDLREAVRGLLQRAYGDAEQRRRVVANDPGYDEKTWSRLAEMGLLGLPFAEEHGGMGAGPIEVAIVAEEIGRVLAPEPYVEAVGLAGGVVAAAGKIGRGHV